MQREILISTGQDGTVGYVRQEQRKSTTLRT